MEKVLDLKMPGVQELGREELKEVEGGTEIGYWIGYWITEAIKTINEANKVGGSHVSAAMTTSQY